MESCGEPVMACRSHSTDFRSRSRGDPSKGSSIFQMPKRVLGVISLMLTNAIASKVQLTVEQWLTSRLPHAG
jgi:hypothetical protein